MPRTKVRADKKLRKNVSARNALTPEELEFCKIYMAQGGAQLQDPYYRSHCIWDEETENWIPMSIKDRNSPPATLKKKIEAARLRPVGKTTAVNRAQSLLTREVVADYIKELQMSPGEKARRVLAEQVFLGDEKTAASASKEILAREDKLGQRDAVEQWAAIMCEIGAEVVVPLPGGGEAAFPMSDMFPNVKRKQKNAGDQSNI